MSTKDYTAKLIQSINRCLIPKLTKNYEESSYHLEIGHRNNMLDRNFELLVECLGDLTLRSTKEASTIIASLYILYKELKCDFLWNNEKTKEYSNKLNLYFEVLGDIPLEKVLYEKKTFNIQEIFDKCLDILITKLSSEDFKKYPSQIEVFCILLADLMKYKVAVKPQKIFPVTLLLTDDYIYANKQKGLLCCLSALQCLKLHDFDGGNYYEVVYRSLKRTIFEKDVKITILTHACLLELFRIFPPDIKSTKLDDMYSGILDQIMTESNIYRKAECLKFAKSIIQMHQVSCVNKNSFKTIICDCLDMCTNEIVADIVLNETLECLEQWITYCWCVWMLSRDYKIISSLLKVLYTCKNEETALNIQRLVIILINLCKENEQKQILENLNNVSCIDDEVFKKRVEEIKTKTQS